MLTEFNIQLSCISQVSPQCTVLFPCIYRGVCVCIYFWYTFIYIYKGRYVYPYICVTAEVTICTQDTTGGTTPSTRSLSLPQGPARGEPRMGAPSSLSPHCPLRSHWVWAPSSRLYESLLPWTCDPGSVTVLCSTRTIRQIMHSYFGLYETWRLQSCTELRQGSTNCSGVQRELGIKCLGTISLIWRRKS